LHTHILRNNSENKWQPSTIYSDNVESSDTSIRKSEKALIERDSTVQCIEQRALDFQGWPVDTFVERLWTQRYTISGHYAHHYDWAFASKTAHRVSTFMVYIEANCTGGGTNFPLLARPQDKRWCEFVDCEEPEENGVTFLPKAGAAVFWENFDVDGKGWKQGLHAGMPVHSGVKIGLNIWSW
jgi:prolyl 4-hydroxylase